ncbi:MAG: hypothetical protein EBX68_02680 [Betaproteobacteria bacterium]|nr:hypothetical protein [Betaproteobacteria bacterium]
MRLLDGHILEVHPSGNRFTATFDNHPIPGTWSSEQEAKAELEAYVLEFDSFFDPDLFRDEQLQCETDATGDFQNE